MNHLSFPEQAVAGAILIDARSLQIAREITSANDFVSAPCAAIFRAAIRLSDAGEIVDPVTIQRSAAAHGDNLPTDFLVQLMEIVPTAANVVQYAQAVHDGSVRRALQNTAETLWERVNDETIALPELISGALEQMQHIKTGTTSSIISSEDAAADFLTYRDEVESGRVATVSTGFTKLDKLLGGGMVQSGLYILAARPGIGKTTIGLKVADRASARMPVLFVSLEMDVSQLTARRVADRTGIRIGKLMTESALTDDERSKLAKASADIAETKLCINRSAGATVDEIALIARTMPNIGLICIDYLGLIANGDKSSLYEKVTANSNALKRLARSLKIPVLCLAQLNRQSEQRQDKTPSMSDLRDSGAIEQDADGVILLHRPAVYLPQEQKPKPWESEPLEITVAKNRHGQTGRITLNFYGVNGRISE